MSPYEETVCSCSTVRLTIQNTASRQVRNLFYLVAVFISFPLRAPTPPRPLYFGGGKYQKNKIACSVGDGVWTCLCRRGRGGGRGAV